MNLYAPYGVWTLLKNHLSEKEFDKHIDKYMYFIHKVVEEKIFNPKEEYVELLGRYLANVVTERRLPRIKKALIDNLGIIETDGIFIYQHPCADKEYEPKPYGYKIGEKFRHLPIVTYWVNEPKFEHTIQRVKAKHQQPITDKTLQFLYYHLKEVKIDLDAAKEELQQRIQTEEYSDLKASLEELSIDCIADGDFRLRRDSKSNRVHTNLTNLSKWIRNHLHVESGEELWNLDIANSQPLLFAIPLRETYGVNLPADVKFYIELCEQGKFYKYMMHLMNVPEELRDDEKFKKKFKQDVFGHLFYCQLRLNFIYDESNVFAQHFPNCFQVILDYKRNDYKKLSIKMQQAESELIIKNTVGRIADKYKYAPDDFFCLTIHDSLIVTKSNVDEARATMLEEFAKHHLKPTINPEALKKPRLLEEYE